MDYSLPGSSIHGIFQAGVLEWDAIAFSGYPLQVGLKEMIQMNLLTKQKQTYRLREQIYGTQRGRMEGEDS